MASQVPQRARKTLKRLPLSVSPLPPWPLHQEVFPSPTVRPGQLLTSMARSWEARRTSDEKLAQLTMSMEPGRQLGGKAGKGAASNGGWKGSTDGDTAETRSCLSLAPSRGRRCSDGLSRSYKDWHCLKGPLPLQSLLEVLVATCREHLLCAQMPSAGSGVNEQSASDRPKKSAARARQGTILGWMLTAPLFWQC